MYNLISNIIANRIKLILAEVVSKEQFGFLGNHQILEAVGLTQEVLPTIKVRNLDALVLKMDLIKVYDRVNWVFLRLLLLHIGLNLTTINWIMVYVTSANFAVLINGDPTKFLDASRGIHLAFPLSPLLLLLVIDGLSLMIEDMRKQGRLLGIRYSSSLVITHLLFVDDVVLFGRGRGSLGEWKDFNKLICLFCSASGMRISRIMSSFLHHGVGDELYL